jgi:hypothetical protein
MSSQRIRHGALGRLKPLVCWTRKAESAHAAELRWFGFRNWKSISRNRLMRSAGGLAETVLSPLGWGALEAFMVGAVLVSRASHVAHLATVLSTSVRRAHRHHFVRARGGDCRQS